MSYSGIELRREKDDAYNIGRRHAEADERARLRPLLERCTSTIDLLLDALENGTLVPSRVHEKGAKALDDLRAELDK